MNYFTSEQITKELQELHIPQKFHNLCMPIWNAVHQSFNYCLPKTRVYFRAFIDTVEG